MAAPPNKAALLSIQEGKKGPVVSQAAPPPKKKQRDMSHQSPGVIKTSVEPQAPEQLAPMPTARIPQGGPPIPSLQKLGVNMNIYDVNRETQMITDAYKRRFGYTPKPGLVFDILKSSHLTGQVDYNSLFGIPTSKKELQASVAARSLDMDPIATLPDFEPKAKLLITGLKDAIKSDNKIKGGFRQVMTGANDPDASPNATAFYKTYKEAFDAAMQDPKERDIITKGLMEVAPWNPMAQRINPASTHLRASEDYARFKMKELQASGIVPPSGLVGFVGKAAGQIGIGTTNMPFGFYQIVRAAGLDLYDEASVAPHSLGLPTTEQAPNHLTNLGVQMGKAVWRDVNQPTKYPGFLIQDIWAAATLGAGAASKINRGTLRGLPPEGTTMGYQIPRGDEFGGIASYQATLPLSDTAVVRFLQQNTPMFGRKARQERLAAEMTDGYETHSIPQMIDQFMSTPAMIRRAKEKEAMTRMAIDLTPVVEMTRLAQWDAWAKDVIKEAGWHRPKAWKGVSLKHKLGVEKALHLIMSDDPDPVGVWTAFHEHQILAITAKKEEHLSDSVAHIIDASDGAINPDDAFTLAGSDVRVRRVQRQFDSMLTAHRSQLDAIDLAKQIILNPTERFRNLLDRAYEVSYHQQKWKGIVSGFPDEKFDEHIAAIMGRVRGDHIIDMGDGTRGVAPYPVNHLFEDMEQVTAKLKDAKTRLANAERNERLHPGTMTDEIRLAKAAVERHTLTQASLDQRIAAVREESRPLKRVIGQDGKVDADFLKAHVAEMAHGLNTKLTWGPTHDLPIDDEAFHGGTRADNTILITRGESDANLAEINQTDVTSDDEHPRMMRDTVHNRDETNNYVGALHELGHVFYNKSRSEQEATAQWEAEEYRTPEQLKLEEEAWSWVFALGKSVEPLRAAVYEQARKWFDSYESFYRAGGTVDMAASDLRPGLPDRIGRTGTGPAYDEFLRLEDDVRYGDALADIRRDTPGSAYSGPLQPEKYRGSRVSERIGGGRNKFGLRPVDFPIKAWTGKSLEMGDFRWDISNLLSEQFHLAYRALFKYVQWHDQWNAAIETPLTDRHRPIRDINTIPDELRTFTQMMDRSQIDHHFADMASDAKMDGLLKALYPTEDEVRSGVIPHEHIRYVRDDQIMDKVGGRDTQFWPTIEDAMSTAMTPINEPMRLMLIFATPAYALNALGSAALLMVRSGHLTPKYLGLAWTAHQHWTPEEVRLVDRLAGDTHPSAISTEINKWTKGSQALQNFWGAITDRSFRRAAVLHELDRHGLLDGNLFENLSNENNLVKVNHASQAGRKTMLDFNSLSWPERAVLRHLFFVYSFVRASGIWSLRYQRDHGFQADVLAKAGEGRQQNIDNMIGKMPSWFMRSGYFALHPDTIYNPIQWNMPGMLEQIGTPLSSMFGQTPYSSAAELWGPSALFASEAFTGVDPSGQKLPHSDKLAKVPGLGGTVGDSFLSLYNQTFLGQVQQKEAKAKKQKAQPLKPEPVTSSFLNPIASAEQRERSGLNQSVFDVDGFHNTWGLAIFRSGINRGVNPVAGAARYWRDLRQTDPQAYHQHERDMVNQMIKRQEKVVGEPISGEALRAVDTVAHVSQAIEDYQLKHRGEPQLNQKTVTQITLKTLAAEGHIKAQPWLDRLNKAIGPTEINSIRMEALFASGAKSWKTWVDKVNTIASYAGVKYEGNLAKLEGLGLGTYSTQAPEATKWNYGRQSETILAKSKEIAARAASLTGDRQKAAVQEWIGYVNENDHEINVGGNTFPSPFAYQYAGKTDAERHKAVVSWTKKKPSEMTAFQQQILTGQRPDKDVVRGWDAIDKALADARSKLPFGKHLPQGARVDVENQVAAQLPAFKKELAFERLPLAARMTTYKVIQDSPNKAAWDWTLRQAVNVYKVGAKAYTTEDGHVKQSLVSELWRREAVPQVLAHIKADFPNFTSELRLYTGATNDQNDDANMTKFLNRLVSP